MDEAPSLQLLQSMAERLPERPENVKDVHLGGARLAMALRRMLPLSKKAAKALMPSVPLKPELLGYDFCCVGFRAESFDHEISSRLAIAGSLHKPQKSQTAKHLAACSSGNSSTAQSALRWRSWAGEASQDTHPQMSERCTQKC